MGRDNAETKEETLRKLFVGGLPRSTTDEDFKDYFSQFGEVVDSIVLKDNNGNSKGFGFVTFATDTEAEQCIQAKSQGHTVCGKSVEVKRAIPRDADPDQREKNTKMFVGGLSLNSTEDSIRQFFEQTFNCQVESVDLIYQKKDQLEPGQEPRPRGFGFVTINDFDVVDRICVIRNHKIDGKEVEVKKAAPKGKSNAGGSGRGRNQGDFNSGGYNQGGYNQGGYNRGGYNQGGGYNNQGSYNNQGGYNQGGYNQGGYNQGGYNQGGYDYNGGYSNQGYNGGYNQQVGSGYQNNSFSGPDKNARGGKQNNRGSYRPY